MWPPHPPRFASRYGLGFWLTSLMGLWLFILGMVRDRGLGNSDAPGLPLWGAAIVCVEDLWVRISLLVEWQSLSICRDHWENWRSCQNTEHLTPQTVAAVVVLIFSSIFRSTPTLALHFNHFYVYQVTWHPEVGNNFEEQWLVTPPTQELLLNQGWHSWPNFSDLNCGSTEFCPFARMSEKSPN